MHVISISVPSLFVGDLSSLSNTKNSRGSMSPNFPSKREALPRAACKYLHFSKNILYPPPPKNKILDTPLDLCLIMAPCARALQEVINICYHYSNAIELNFNATKSACVAFTRKNNKLSLRLFSMKIFFFCIMTL